MRTLVIGIGGMTNAGKSTLSSSLHLQIPNSCIMAQDDFFKEDSMIAVDSNGFKQYDVLDALHMDRIMSEIELWQKNPGSFLLSHGLRTQCSSTSEDSENVFVLIVEGFLIFNYKPLNELIDKRYFLEIPYDICKERRGSRIYTPPDPPGYFDGHVWPMYLKHRQEMEYTVSDIATSF
ncbi:nicotinamide riboside kinase 1 isoform X3 [Esox lucius]|uniref:nicotinamide riboside kinase 1 isoform X3 n=1 Tax=Esox lucius TaxID=8010 RepID=UPI000577F1E3|nr:nicotinamide riboside kinase 1 isoform X3 [Esox lucius]